MGRVWPSSRASPAVGLNRLPGRLSRHATLPLTRIGASHAAPAVAEGHSQRFRVKYVGACGCDAGGGRNCAWEATAGRWACPWGGGTYGGDCMCARGAELTDLFHPLRV